MDLEEQGRLPLRLEFGRCRKRQSRDFTRKARCGWLLEAVYPAGSEVRGEAGLLQMTYSAGRVKLRQRDGVQGST